MHSPPVLSGLEFLIHNDGHLILNLGIIPTLYYLSDDHSTFDSGNCYDLPVLKLCLPYNTTGNFLPERSRDARFQSNLLKDA